jgi:hypothetical protein
MSVVPPEALSERPEIAFYYPNPFWRDGDWIKNLILFFDGIALLVPDYMQDQIEQSDPAIVSGLREHGLLHIIEPESAVGKTASASLATMMTDVLVSGVLDKLAEEPTAFHELSMSRLGYHGDEGLAQMIFEELKQRGLAQDSQDGVSVRLHPMVRSLILTLLSQILRVNGTRLDAELCPVTDRAKLVEALQELLNLPNCPASGRVIAFDLATVGVNLASVPMDEILSFRRDNQALYRNYRRSVRLFAFELSRMAPDEQRVAFEARQDELDAIASNIRRTARKAWKKPCSLAFGLAGAAWRLAHGDPFGAMLAASAATIGFEPSKGKEVGAYSYLFHVHGRYS